MTEIFTRPTTPFPAVQIADNITILANQTVQKIIQDLKHGYHSTWSVSEPGKGASRTQAEQQEVVDAIDLQSLVQMREAAYEILLTIRTLCTQLLGAEGTEAILPEAYLSPAWELSTEGTPGTPQFRIIVGELKAAWQVPTSEPEEPTP
jgi:hypothetical protein